MEFKEDTGTWFYFKEEDESQGGVCLRTLSPTESSRIDRLTIKKKNKFKAGVHFVETEVDEKMSSRLMWDYVITDWVNISLGGKEIECNATNKVMMINIPIFSNFILKSLEKLQDNIENGIDLAKNS